MGVADANASSFRRRTQRRRSRATSQTYKVSQRQTPLPGVVQRGAARAARAYVAPRAVLLLARQLFYNLRRDTVDSQDDVESRQPWPAKAADSGGYLAKTM